MEGEVGAVIGFVVLFALMALRIPIGIAMGIVGVGGFVAFVGIDPALNLVGLTTMRTATNYAFGLLPLFILMGNIATESGMSRELFSFSRSWLGHFRGGLAMATICACGGFAAICGSSLATAATISRIAVPEMRSVGYSEALSCGVVAAGGTLGILIPPSIVLAIYGIIVEQDIAQLFIAGIIPGAISIMLYLGTLQVIAVVRPDALPRAAASRWPERWRTFGGVWAVIVLFLFVLGGIYAGWFAPTEAAGVGSVGAFLIAKARRQLSWRQLMKCLVATVRTTGSIFTMLIGAILFGYFLTVTDTTQNVIAFIGALPVDRGVILALILLFYMFLGCILDSLAMIILTIPIVYPLIIHLGFDPIWFGIIVVITVELGLITPPIGINVFVMRAVNPDVPITTIYRGVLPFVATDIVRLFLFSFFPWLVMFLPQTMG